MTITRAKFEQLIDAADRARRRPVPAGARRTPKLDAEQIDEVVLVGGSTRMPAVQQLVKEIFGKEPQQGRQPRRGRRRRRRHPGRRRSRGERARTSLLLDVTPLSLGIETLGGVMTTLIARNTTIPTEQDARRSRPPPTTRRR